MCERCSQFECAFGSRDPLPPKIASLDLEPVPTDALAKTGSGSRNPLRSVNDHGHIKRTDHTLDSDEPSLQPQASSSNGFSEVSERVCEGEGVELFVRTREPTSSSGVETSSRGSFLNSKSVNPTQQDTVSVEAVKSDVGNNAALSTVLPDLQSMNHALALLLSHNPTGKPISSKSGSHTSAKWSDVVTYGSNPAPPKNLAADRGQIIITSIMEHTDLLHTLMLNCPDFSTLFTLVTSCKTAKDAFEQHPQGVIKAMLSKMPQELQHLTIALIGINGSSMWSKGAIKDLMETWLGKGPKPLAERLRVNPVETLKKLARSFSAIDLFMEVIPKNCVNNFADYKKVLASREGLDYSHVTELINQHPLLQQTEWSDVPDDTEWDVPGLPAPEFGPQDIALPLSDREMYRMKRALLRYEIFCALFYLGEDHYFDKHHHSTRLHAAPLTGRRRAFYKDQITFLKDYVNPWEIGELAVVSHFMFDLVRHAYFHKYKTLRYNEAYDSWYGRWGNRNHGRNRHDDHEDVVDEFDNHMVWFASQGLTLLQTLYNDRHLGYQAMVDKHGEPRFRPAELFVPFQKSADRHGSSINDPSAKWIPRQTWPDTSGLELPSKGWLAKSPGSDDKEEIDAYWGEKWARKIGYPIWDRD